MPCARRARDIAAPAAVPPDKMDASKKVAWDAIVSGKSINVVVDRKDFSVASIEMLELSDDNTLFRFTNKELNAAIPDSLFDIK
jgi:outer membrane lipoprotein-sorting protein